MNRLAYYEIIYLRISETKEIGNQGNAGKNVLEEPNHLLNLISHRKTLILTPSQFLKQFREELRV